MSLTNNDISYPGFDPNENRGPRLNAVAIIFLCVSVVTMGLRAFSRVYTTIPFGLDDGLIVGAAVGSWAYTAVSIVEVEQNFYGQHITKSDPYHAEQFGKNLYALAIIYPIALTLSKLSLLALYWRIFRVTTARLPLQIIAGLNIAWMLAAFFVGIFSCTPIKANWNTKIPHHCVDYPSLFLSNEAITIALDLFVLLMPVYFISQIQRSLTQRISISITFVLGLIVTIVSGLRLWRLVLANRLPAIDVTYVELDAALWAIIELNVWILVASIPTLRPLFNKLLGEKFKSTSGSGGRKHGTYTSTYSQGSSGFASSIKSLKSKIFPSSLGRSHDRSMNQSNSRTALHGTSKGTQTAHDPDEGLMRLTGPAMSAPAPTVPKGSAATGRATAQRWDRDFEMNDMSAIRVQRDVEVGLEPHVMGRAV